MPLRLTLFPTDKPGSRHLFTEGHRYRVGRDARADIILTDPRISRDHLLIDGTGDVWRIRDLASKNGTRLDGRLIHAAKLDKRAWLSVGGVPVLAEPLSERQALAEDTAEGRRRTGTARIKRALGPGQAPEELITRSLEALRRIAECERSGLWLIGNDAQPVMARLLGPDAPPPSRGIIEQVIESGQPVFCSDTADADALARRESIVSGGIRAVAALPLSLEGRIAGLLYADSRQPGKLFTDLDAELLAGIAEQVGLTLAVTRVRDAIDALSDAPAAANGTVDPEFRRLLDEALPPFHTG